MNFEPPKKRLPIWLVFLALLIIFPFLGRLFPLLILFWLFSKTKLYDVWKKKFTEAQKRGFDISRFQNKASSVPSEKSAQSSPFSSSFSSPMNDFRLQPKHIFGAIGTLLLAFLIIDGFYNVPPGHVGVIYDRGRGVLDEERPEGLHVKVPFWQVATIMDTRLQAYTMSIATHEGQRSGDDSIEALTKDGQKVDIDVTIQYRIQGKKASDIFQTVGLDYEIKIIRPEVRSVIREVVTGYESKQLFNLESRQEASSQMEVKLSEQYRGNDIILDALLLRNVRFSDVYLNAIEEKQVAQQKIEKAEFERQEAEIIKEKVIIEAQAESESIRLKGEALSRNPEVIQLEFVNKMSDQVNWGILPDGVLPLLDLKNLQN